MLFPRQKTHLRYWSLLIALYFSYTPVYATETGEEGDNVKKTNNVTGIHPENAAQHITIMIDSAWQLENEGMVEAAISATRDAIRLSRDFHLNALEQSALQQLGDIFYFDEKMDSARIYYHQGLAIAKMEEDSFGITDLLGDIAWSFYPDNQLDSINLYCLEMIKIGQANKNFTHLFEASRLLGDLYYFVEEYNTTLQYGFAALKLLPSPISQLDDIAQLELAGLYATISGAYTELQSLDSALYYVDLSDAIVRSLDDSLHLMWNPYGRGYIDLYRGNMRLGIAKCMEAYRYFDALGEENTTGGCLECAARGYLKLGQLDSAEYYFKEAMLHSSDNSAHDFLADIYESLAQIYEQQGDFAQSLHFHKLFKEQTDSLYQVAKRNNIALLQSTFRFKELKAEQEKLLLLAKSDEAIFKGQRTANILISIALVLTGLLAGFMGYYYRTNKSRNTLLSEEVDRRTKELSDMNTSLMQANAELEEFAHISSHDLREPIRNITSFSSLIKRKASDISGDDLNEFVSIIQFNARQMQQLVNDIYDFTRINKDEISLTKVVLTEVIDDIIKILNGSITDRNAIIDTSLCQNAIITNRGMLFLVLRNLVENGVKYNTSEQPRIQITLEETANAYLWKVKDNGIGIPTAYHQRVFELFKRLHNREEFQGSGLGLSISRKIVQRLQGEIGVDSIEGEGSTFWFTLPKLHVN